jgi:hypothetical protein
MMLTVVISNLSAPERIHTRRHQKKASSTADQEVEGDRVPSGHIGIYDFISAYDQTTANKRIILQVISGAETVTLADKTVGTDDRALDVQTRIYVPEGGYFMATIVSPTSGDVCQLAYSGYLVRCL